MNVVVAFYLDNGPHSGLADEDKEDEDPLKAVDRVEEDDLPT